jgi:hypothetical protein
MWRLSYKRSQAKEISSLGRTPRKESREEIKS